MKVKKIIMGQSWLLKLKLTQTKMHWETDSFPSLQVEDVACRLKKGLQVIFKYHDCKKRIVFVGVLSPKQEAAVKILLQGTRHIFVPERLWLNERSSNNKLSQPCISRSDSSHKVLPLKNTYDLAVIINCSVSDIGFENYKAKIPTIVLSNNLDIFDVIFSYKILGNFDMTKQILKSHLFLILLHSFFKKVELVLKIINSNKFKIKNI